MKAGVARVAIERPDGPVIDALFAAGLEVVVIASRHVKALASIQETASKLRNQAVKDGQKSVTGDQVLGLWLEVINQKFEVEPGDEPGKAKKAKK